MVIDDSGPKTEGVPDHIRYGRMKLLQFHENYRPAYWGTWSKKSTHISPRCPLKLDKVKNLWILRVLTQKMDIYLDLPKLKLLVIKIVL